VPAEVLELRTRAGADPYPVICCLNLNLNTTLRMT
jgi:hypothetical protein